MSRAAVLDLCAEFDIKVVPKHTYPAPGETRAIATLGRILQKRGEGHLRFVLSTIAETKGAGGLLTEVTLWAVSDLVRACPQWADERASDWLDAWDQMPFGDMIFNVYELRGFVSQRCALAGAAFHWLSEHLRPKDEGPRQIHLRYLDDDEKLRLGQQLLDAKLSMPRGHFGPWLVEQGTSTVTAQKLMRIAKDDLRERDPAAYIRVQHKRSLDEKIELGRMFIRQKQALPRGGLTRWLLDNGYYSEMARVCMKLAREAGAELDEVA